MAEDKGSTSDPRGGTTGASTSQTSSAPSDSNAAKTTSPGAPAAPAPARGPAVAGPGDLLVDTRSAQPREGRLTALTSHGELDHQDVIHNRVGGVGVVHQHAFGPMEEEGGNFRPMTAGEQLQHHRARSAAASQPSPKQPAGGTTTVRTEVTGQQVTSGTQTPPAGDQTKK